MQWNISTPESCPEQQYIEIFFNTKNWCYFSYHWHTPLRSSTCPRPGSGCSRWWCWHGSAWRGCPPPPEHPSSPSPTDDSGWSPSIPPNCCPERMQCQFSKNYFYKLFWVVRFTQKGEEVSRAFFNICHCNILTITGSTFSHPQCFKNSEFDY